MTAKSLVALILCLAGTASTAVAGTGSALSAPAPATRAERVAASFTAAADAEKSGDRAGLIRAVQTIQALAAHPLDPATENPVEGWKAAAAPAAMPVYRGRPLGPGYRSGRLLHGGTESFSQLFLSGTGATIALSAPTGDRLGLRVLDPQSRPICAGDAVRSGLCRWVPLFTQRYTIEVTNLGAGDARYFLVVE
ncbi:MAG: hypothetical protein ABI673_05735 [Novosphingobium sp.]